MYKEKIDNIKKISLALCFIGAFIAVTNGRLDFKTLNGFGLLLGVGASITYSCMPIISKTALKYGDSVTLIIYGFLFGVCLMMLSAYIATNPSNDKSVQDEYETAC